MLLGPFVVAPVVFLFLQHRSTAEVRSDAAKAVFASDAEDVQRGLRPVYSVLVPLTNGTQLYVTDCALAHPGIITPLPPVDSNSERFERMPHQGVIHSGDCVYFKAKSSELSYDRYFASVPLGDVNQIQIEKDYWSAYAKAKNQKLNANAVQAGFMSLWGFPIGITVWLFYRLVRFAVKG